MEPRVRGDVAWASFRSDLSAELGGERLEAQGRGTAILERGADPWRVVHLHTSG